VGATAVLLLSSGPFEEFGYCTDLPGNPTAPSFSAIAFSRASSLVPLGGRRGWDLVDYNIGAGEVAAVRVEPTTAERKK